MDTRLNIRPSELPDSRQLHIISIDLHKVNFLSEQEYYNKDLNLPVFAKGNGTPSSTKDVVEILLNILDRSVVCSATPVYVRHNVEFIVDTNKLDDWKDIRTDMNACLTRSGTKTLFFKEEDGKISQSSAEKCSHIISRYIYSHRIDKDFHKVIISVRCNQNNVLLPLFYVQYYFDGKEHDIQFDHQHGNSKSVKTMKQTTHSVQANIKSLHRDGLKGKAIYSKLNQSAGGYEKARTAAYLPHSSQQIYDVTRKNKCKTTAAKDELIELIDLCKETNDKPDAFIREVRTAPELSVVLCNNRQIDDLSRFCTGPCLSILGVDPTFNLCDYNVTVTTYRHPMVTVKETGKHPVLLGPVLIHSHKTFDSYFTLPTTMLRLNPKLTSLKAFGTDGEKSLFESLKASFHQADHLLCWLHVKDNVQKKLAAIGVKDKGQYMREIFGQTAGDLKVRGLLDCETDEEFEEEWKNLEMKWDERGMTGVTFKRYMVEHKKELMKKSMTAGVRRRCGLGDPPAEYDKNANESMNSVLKKSMTKDKKLSLKETVRLLQQEVKFQCDKLKLSMLGKGEWQLCEPYNALFGITEEAFYLLNQDKRERLDLQGLFQPVCLANASVSCLFAVSSLTSHENGDNEVMPRTNRLKESFKMKLMISYSQHIVNTRT